MCLESCLTKFSYLKAYPVYIDGSNIAYSGFNELKKPSLSDLLLILDYLINKLEIKSENIHCICDPALKYYIDKATEYQALIKEGVIIEAPKVADEFILSFALKHDFCFIISNDRFKSYIGKLPSKQWLNEREISFMIINNKVCLSPNIDYKKLEAKNIFSLKRHQDSTTVTTTDVLNRIETSKGRLNLF